MESSRKDTSTVIAVPLPTDDRIISERIDGPANIRDRVDGRLLFELNDQVAVSATAPEANWVQIGIFADLNQTESNQLTIRRGSSIFVGGIEVGKALDDIRITESFKTNEGWHGELKGYTSVQNIREHSIPEARLSILLKDSTGVFELKDFDTLFYEFEFQKGDGILPALTDYSIDETWLDDPSPLYRLILLFEDQKLFGVVHSRNLNVLNAYTFNLNRGFCFTTLQEKHPLNNAFIRSFNEFIEQAD